MTNEFPARPTAEQIDAEYTPDRVMRLCRYVAIRIKQPQEYEELLSMAALSFYERVKQYKEGRAAIPDNYSFYYWLLFRILNDVKEQFKRERRKLGGRKVVQLKHVLREQGLPVGTFVENILLATEDNHAEDTVDLLTLREAMHTLTERQSQIVQLVYFEHMSQAEVAEKLGIAQPNVSKTLHRALLKMRKVMEL